MSSLSSLRLEGPWSSPHRMADTEPSSIPVCRKVSREVLMLG